MTKMTLYQVSNGLRHLSAEELYSVSSDYADAIDAHLAPREVSDEDVERACEAYEFVAGDYSERDAMRAALQADRQRGGVVIPDDIVERLKVAARALIRERVVYAEDVETLADVARLLEALLTPRGQVGGCGGVKVPDGFEVDADDIAIAVRCKDGRKALLRSDRSLTYNDRVLFDFLKAMLAAAPDADAEVK